MSYVIYMYQYYKVEKHVAYKASVKSFELYFCLLYVANVLESSVMNSQLCIYVLQVIRVLVAVEHLRLVLSL